MTFPGLSDHHMLLHVSHVKCQGEDCWELPVVTNMCYLQGGCNIAKEYHHGVQAVPTVEGGDDILHYVPWLHLKMVAG